MNDNFKVGNRIKQMRIKKNISVFELACEIEISSSHLYKIENGHCGMSLELLSKIADSLETDANSILGYSGKDETSIDALLNELPLEIKEKMVSLFETMIEQVEAGKIK